MNTWQQAKQTLVDFFQEHHSDLALRALIILGQVFLLTLVLQISKRITSYFFREKFPEIYEKKFGDRYKTQRADTLSRLANNAIIYMIYFMYFYTLLTLLGFPIGTLLAGAGIAGVALGLGVKDFIIDIINGFFIIFERQIEVGDFAEVGGVYGRVSSVGIRSTVLVSADGVTYYVPNRHISVVHNYSQVRHRALIDLPYSTDFPIIDYRHCVESATEELIQTLGDRLTREPEIFGLVETTKNTYQFRVAYFMPMEEQPRLTAQIFDFYFTRLQEEGFSDSFV